MVRRQFIQGIAGLGAIEAVAAVPTKSVTFHIEGFTCITCAVGLDSLLKDQKGIVRSKSSYPDRTAVIDYNPALVTEEAMKGYIAELGFRVRGEKG